MADRLPRPPGKHLFVYGSLVAPGRLDEVLGQRFDGERLRARLPGFERCETNGFDYPFILENPDGIVDGVLIMDLSDEEFAALDVYEEVQCGFYSRASVEVEAWGCGPRPLIAAAQTYVAGPGLRRLKESAAAQTRPSTAK
jgi:hypothetical protein